MSDSTALKGATPLFLIGPPRSGTTVLSKLLNAHTNMLLTNETAVFLQLDRMIKKSATGSLAGIIFGKSHHNLWASHLKTEAKRLVESFYTKIAELEGKSDILYWGEKHPHLSSCLDFISELYPTATYIYTIRDPRDTICSIAKMTDTPIEKSLGNWTNFSNRYEEFVASISHDRVVVVKYEDLVKDYESTLENIFSTLNLGFDDASKEYLKEYKGRDSHGLGSSINQIFNFSEKSVGRWSWDMSSEEESLVRMRCGQFMTRYGYTNMDGVRRERRQFIAFECNICGSNNRLQRSSFGRENPSCKSCKSSVRTRSIVHLLSTELFGESLKLLDFPISKDISGIGLSDWFGYAGLLAEVFSYTNTFYHKSPRFDICNPEALTPVDFLIASEVFEHVRPPVIRAFNGAFTTLKNGGLLVFTAPFGAKLENTIEHFPELDNYKLVKRKLFDSSKYDLINITPDGRKQVFRDVRLHGGGGETLEMRVFSMRDLVRHLHTAGFNKVVVRSDDYQKFGIIWLTPHSIPIIAYKS